MKATTLPKLPRFDAPKRMTSVKFMTKRDKLRSRRALNAMARDY